MAQNLFEKKYGVKVGDKVRIKSQNDLLRAYEKARTPFIVASVAGEYVTLKFAEDGQKFDCVMYDYEILPYIS